MSRRSDKFQLPLKNITASFNTNNMAYPTNSGLYNLTNSPMSSLAINLSELSTGRNTPKLRRKLSLSSLDTPPNDCGRHDQESSNSAESGCFSESPLDDSPTLGSLSVKRYTTALHPEIPLEAFSVKKKTIAFRRINSQPLPAMRLDSPTDFLEEDRGEPDDDDFGRTENRHGYETDETMINENEENYHAYRRNKLYSDDATSQDSGLGFENDRLSQRSSVSSFDDAGSSSSSSIPLNRLSSLEDVWNSMDSPGFKAPKGKPPKRSRSLIDDKQYSEDTCSPIKYSPVKPSSIPRPSFSKALFCEIPESVNEASDGNKYGIDDGFQELFKLNDLDNEADDRVSSLINSTLLHRAYEDKPEKFMAEEVQGTSKGATPSGRPNVARRGLYRSQSLNIRSRQSFKRCEPSCEDVPPVQCKRWKGEDITMNADNYMGETSSRKNCRLQRCLSETEAIKSAVSLMLSDPDLIGDCSKVCCLPTTSGKHQDLKSITPETLSRLMADEFSDIVEEFHIIDCRYPYEYAGGHILNALNIYTKEDVVEKYMKSPLHVKDPSKRIILVFHCEFSSERGPGLFRFLRQQDREANTDFYPYLHYPEIYLLEGGYKSFFETFSHLCEPRTYKTMFDKNHTEDLRKFRIKSKSWQDEKSQARSGVRNLKF